jgi:hypothetical protein
MKWVYIKNRLTTVRTIDLPWTHGNPSTKSMEMSAHTADGMSNSYSRPAGWSYSALFHWHISQVRTNSTTKACVLGTWKSAHRRCNVLATPSWPAPWVVASTRGMVGEVAGK